MLPHQPARLSTFIDELAIARAARQGFKTQGAGAGKKVQHPRPFQFKSGDAMGQDVEHRFAHPVRGGPRRLIRRCCEMQPLKLSADDPHHSS